MNYMSLLSFRKKVYSQFGEEGIIQAIFSELPRRGTLDRIGTWTVEMGAGDGRSESNTKIFEDRGAFWRGLMIEGNLDKAAQIKKNTPGAIAVCRHVAPGQLDDILKAHEFPHDLDLLSLDVDGDEWYHLKSLKARPRVIVVEINPSIDFRTNFVQHQGDCVGCSTLAMWLLAQEMGYTAVCYDMPNMFLVRSDDWRESIPYANLYAAGEGAQGRLEAISDYRGHAAMMGWWPWGAAPDRVEIKGAVLEQWTTERVLSL